MIHTIYKYFMTQDCYYGVCIQEKKHIRVCTAQALEGTIYEDSVCGEMKQGAMSLFIAGVCTNEMQHRHGVKCSAALRNNDQQQH